MPKATPSIYANRIKNKGRSIDGIREIKDEKYARACVCVAYPVIRPRVEPVVDDFTRGRAFLLHQQVACDEAFLPVPSHDTNVHVAVVDVTNLLLFVVQALRLTNIAHQTTGQNVSTYGSAAG